jgi:hypothetical protein
MKNENVSHRVRVLQKVEISAMAKDPEKIR